MPVSPMTSSVEYLRSVTPWREVPRLYRITDRLFSRTLLPLVCRATLASGRRSYKDLSIDGRDRLPKGRDPVLFVANHLSYLDPPLVTAAVTVASGKKPVIMAKRELWKKLGYRIAFPIVGAMPFDRQPNGREAYLEGLRRFASALLAGKSVLEFAEATIPGELELGETALVKRRSEVSRTHGLLDSAGFLQVAELSYATGAIVVPVGVSGTGSACPPEVNPAKLFPARKKRDHRIRIVFGEPFRLSDFVTQVEPGRERRAFFPFASAVLPKAISALVDFSLHEVPIDHPITAQSPITDAEMLRITEHEREVAAAYRRRGGRFDEDYARLAAALSPPG